jgi:GT2 family glycosyltransferase/glycosyltransferase involved in cell wall biosynthesis
MTFWQEDNAETPVLDIIVPVHDDREATQHCLASLYVAACHNSREIIVIDDASLDSTLVTWLDGEAATGRITLLRNGERRGFGAAVNLGLSQHPERDVVLLGSHTKVANNWLDRLLACALAQPDIGTVTPFSNDAIIAAYPFESWSDGAPGTLGLAALDDLFSSVNAGEWLDLPTAASFCVLIRRACLDAVGFFDAERFGHGYGEENDFSRRAAAVGWRNVLAADVFVAHTDDSRLDPTNLEAIEDAARTLAALYPDYDAKVQDFLHRDPPASLRARVDRARAALGGSEFAAVMDEQVKMRAARAAEVDTPLCPPLPAVLHISNDLGGDTGRWIQDYCAADLDCRNLVLRGRTSRNDTTTGLELIDLRLGQTPLLSWTLTEPIRGTAIDHPEYTGILGWICCVFDVRALLVSSLIGHSLDLLRFELPVALITHDLYPFCPALCASFGTPCTRCGDDELTRCLRENPQNTFWHITDAHDWQALRAAFAARLPAGNIRIVSPSEDIHARWAALFPGIGVHPWTCIPHGLGAAFVRGPVIPEIDPNDPALQKPEKHPRLRVLIPGRLLPNKGLWLWQQICNDLTAFADVLLLGCGDFGLAFADHLGIEVIPICETDEVPGQVMQWQPDCALLLSVLPESFNYTLAEMQALAVPVVATNIGDAASKIDDGLSGFLVEPNASAVLKKLLALNRSREKFATVVDSLRFSAVRTAFDMVADYRALLPEITLGTVGSEAENLLTTLTRRARGQEEITRLRAHVQARDEEARARAINQRRLETMVEALAKQHAAILHSASWRAGTPLRTLGRLWTSLRLKLAPPEKKPTVVRQRVERRKRPRPETPVPLLLRSRAAARYWLCEAIGVPDGAVIIAGGGPDQPPRALENFIALAGFVTRQSTKACFVWCGRQDSLSASDALTLKLLREVRDMIVLDVKLDAAVFAGADVLLLPAAGEGGVKGTIGGIPRVELPLGLGQSDAGSGGVLTATATQLLQYCAGTNDTAPLEV